MDLPNWKSNCHFKHSMTLAIFDILYLTLILFKKGFLTHTLEAISWRLLKFSLGTALTIKFYSTKFHYLSISIFEIWNHLDLVLHSNLKKTVHIKSQLQLLFIGSHCCCCLSDQIFDENVYKVLVIYKYNPTSLKIKIYQW